MAGHQRNADTPAGGGRADGRTPRAADRGALYYGWAYTTCLRYGGREDINIIYTVYGGSPNAEAGKAHQQVLSQLLLKYLY